MADEIKTDAEIQLEPVVSSNIAGIGFDAQSGRMRVRFNNGGTYEAPGASQADFDDFKLAKSKGVHFNKILKHAFAWTKVEKKG
jgi:hypothetical protein